MLSMKRIFLLASCLLALSKADTSVPTVASPTSPTAGHAFRLESPTAFEDPDAFHTADKDASEDTRISTHNAFFPPQVDLSVDGVKLVDGVKVRNVWFFEETDDGASVRTDGVDGVCKDTVVALRAQADGSGDVAAQEKQFGPYLSLHYLNRESAVNGKFIGVKGLRYFSLLAQRELKRVLGSDNIENKQRFELQVNRPDESKCVVVVSSKHTGVDGKEIQMEQYLDMETFDDKLSRMVLYDSTARIGSESANSISALSRSKERKALFKLAQQLRTGVAASKVKVSITSSKGDMLFTSTDKDGITEANEYMIQRSKLSLIEPVIVKEVLPLPYHNAYCAEDKQDSHVFRCNHVPYDHDVYHDQLWRSEETCVDMEYSDLDGKLVSGGGSGISLFNERLEFAFGRVHETKVSITTNEQGEITNIDYQLHASPTKQHTVEEGESVDTPLGPLSTKMQNREQEAALDSGYLRAIYFEDHDMLLRLQTQRENISQGRVPFALE